MAYNNEVTYHDKWNTPENKKALSELERKYFDKSECAPDCPIAWAVEVLELMDLIQKDLGFAHNEYTMRGYHVQGNMTEWFIISPWRNFFYSFKSNFLVKPKREKVSKSFAVKVKSLLVDSFRSIGYGFRAFKITKINPLLNKIQRNRVGLGQLKEKYGSLRIYFSAPKAFEDYIETEIKKTEIKLAMKGAYYPLETFWNATTSYGVENEYEPDSISVTHGQYNGKPTVSVTETVYRGIMKDLGVDMEDMKKRAEAKEVSLGT